MDGLVGQVWQEQGDDDGGVLCVAVKDNDTGVRCVLRVDLHLLAQYLAPQRLGLPEIALMAGAYPIGAVRVERDNG